jgi:hypothetical protein
MGILWTVWPTDDQMKEWLDSEGVEYPKSVSRFPKGIEVKEVLNNLEGYTVQIFDNGIGNTWQADIHSTAKPEEIWTLLNISEYSGDDEPQEIWFEKGHEELIKLVLKKISEICGPQVLIADAGGEPQVINA